MKEFRFAWMKTIPILFSYVFLGMAFGVLVENAGYSWIWAGIISLIVYTGAFQFILIGLLSGGASLGTIATTAFLVNSRNLFYGIPFVQDFPPMGWRYPLMIHMMSDETFAVLMATEVPPEYDRNRVRFYISSLNCSYWVLGSILGGLLGNIIPFDLTGIDFSLTALFVTISIDQWRSYKSHLPASLGFGISLSALLLLGPSYFLLPALVLTLVGLLLLRKEIERHG